jgi:hypothetical protein
MGFQRYFNRENKDRIWRKRSNHTWHTKWMPISHAVSRTLRRDGRLD